MVAVAIRDDIPLQHKLIEMLEREDIYEAAFWAKKLKMKNVPSTVSVLLNNIESGIDSFPPEEDDLDDNSNCVESTYAPNSFDNAKDTSWGLDTWAQSPWSISNIDVQKKDFYQFPLANSDIIYIDDKQGIITFLEYLKNSTEVRNNTTMDLNTKLTCQSKYRRFTKLLNH